jgi:FkbM family methyltransferase
MDYSKADIFIDVASSLEAEVRANSCVKEPETVAWIEHDLRPGDVLWDIGANIGAYSLVAAKCHGGKVKICAFEPSFLNFAQLCRNIALNDCGEVIFPLNIALSEKTCVGHFNHQNLVSGGALHAFGEALDYKHEAFRPVLRQDLLSFSVDDLIRIFSLPSPDHIKLDVDGLEMAIMNGAEQTLVGKKVRTILVELGDRDEQLIAFFKRHGFAVREKHPAGPEASHLFNCILVRS